VSSTNNNISTIRHGSIYLCVVIFVAAVGLQTFLLFDEHSSYSESRLEERYTLLEGLTTSLAANVDGDQYKILVEAVPTEQSLRNNKDNDFYFQVHQMLVKTRNQYLRRHGTNIDLYTVNYELEGSNYKVSYGANTVNFPFFSREFDIIPKELFIGSKNGESTGPYDFDESTFVGSFSPIRDSNANVVAFVFAQLDSADLETDFDEKWSSLLLFYCIITAILLFTIWMFLMLIMRFSGRERKAAQITGKKLTNTYNIIEEFVENVKKGDYKTKLNFGEYRADNLARSLDVLHKKLADNASNAGDRNWIAEGRLEIASILRMHNDFEQLSLEVTHELVKYVDAVQGAFYITEGEGDDMLINMTACYAYNRRKFEMKQFKVGQGLVGQCAFEADTIYRTEVPDDYMSISSGILGDIKPKSLLLVPLITDEKLFGIVELASLRTLSDIEIKFVEELSDIIARTIFNLQTSTRTQELLEESLEKGEVLEHQQLELQRQQDELEVSNTRLQEQIEEVNLSQRKMHSLLENSSEIITIYDEDATVLYESPSVTSILGYEANELLGTKDFDRVSSEGKRAIEGMFSTLKKDADQTPVIQFNYQRKDGSHVWLEATGKNLIHDAAIGGIVFNSRDITERREAEREQILRGRMQALSENSPDIIIRFNIDGTFSYTNPMLRDFTGIPLEAFADKHMNEVGIHETIAEGWTSILEEIKSTETNVAREMDFPTADSELVMQVNAIPEFDHNGKLDTVLLVSHDITARKRNELIIQIANKKITDSINYAQRIQNSIIPDNEIIREYFPESFIFYYPKDVVSGDFPWFFQRGDDLYYAAVDCTGHGVPGAMMSLIGYFLLNEITGHPEAYDPATILDKLHEGVRKTLRQDREGAQARDGMDVALCRVNMKTMKMEYSGAHRPLYLVRGDELIQYKGTRKAIGGTHSKGVKEFENHKIDLLKGDDVYFFSDGLPDQFGGDKGLKYSPRRIRRIVSENKHLPMEEMRKYFYDDFEEWKAGRKQIDDVLLIGIRF
jgi:PAS domain S-box-containing protein